MTHQKRAMLETRTKRSWGVGVGLKMVARRLLGNAERVEGRREIMVGRRKLWFDVQDVGYKMVIDAETRSGTIEKMEEEKVFYLC